MEMDVQEEIRKLRADLDKHVQISAHNVSVFSDKLKNMNESVNTKLSHEQVLEICNDSINEKYEEFSEESDSYKQDLSEKFDMYIQSFTEDFTKWKKKIEDAEKHIKSYRFHDIFQEIQALEEEFKKRALKLISESSVSAKK